MYAHKMYSKLNSINFSTPLILAYLKMASYCRLAVVLLSHPALRKWCRCIVSRQEISLPSTFFFNVSINLSTIETNILYQWNRLSTWFIVLQVHGIYILFNPQTNKKSPDFPGLTESCRLKEVCAPSES